MKSLYATMDLIMAYKDILKEIEPHVRTYVYTDEQMNEMEGNLQQIMDSEFTEDECYPSQGISNVSLFMRMLHQKYPDEYKKKVILWMKYVLGPTWTMYTTSAMCIHLNHWIQFITDQLRTELGIEYESESEND